MYPPLLKELSSRRSGKPGKKGPGLSSTIVALALLALTGWTMAPGYTRPEAPVASEWPSGPAYKDTSAVAGDRGAADITLREFFVHGQLRKLIEQARQLEQAREAMIATSEFLEAQEYTGYCYELMQTWLAANAQAPAERDAEMLEEWHKRM